jgi:cell division ATPase FtsA
VLQIPVRVASPEGVGGLTDHLLTPSYSTAIGLLLWAARVVTAEDLQRYEPPPRSQSWDRMRDMLRRFFP